LAPGCNLGPSSFCNTKRKTKKRVSESAMETATAVEIEKGRLRQFFWMISTSCLEKPSQKPLRLSHRYHSADGDPLP
jgi:hypothetical protein